MAAVQTHKLLEEIPRHTPTLVANKAASRGKGNSETVLQRGQCHCDREDFKLYSSDQTVAELLKLLADKL